MTHRRPPPATDDARHRRGGIRRRPSVGSAGGSRPGSRLVSAGQTRRRASPGVTWQAVDVTDRAAVDGAIAKRRQSASFIWPARPASKRRGPTLCRICAINAMGTQHILDAVQRLQRPCRVLVVTSAQVYGASDEPIDEDGAAATAEPVRTHETRAGSAGLSAATGDHLDVLVARPFNHIGPGQSPSLRCRVSRGRLRTWNSGSSHRSCGSATSTRVATSRTCGTWSTPTPGSWTAAEPGRLQRLLGTGLAHGRSARGAAAVVDGTDQRRDRPGEVPSR